MRTLTRQLLAAVLLWLTTGFIWAADSASTNATIRVAVYHDKGTGGSIRNLLEALALDPTFAVTEIKAEDIRAGALKNHDVVIHPGGSGGKQGRHLEEVGREQVRQFVAQGGGYVGFCAGAYLASNDYPWSLNLLDAQVLDKQHWARGTGPVRIQLSEAGTQLFGTSTNQINIYYGQGPLLAPKEDPEVPDYQELATYATEIAKKGAPEGVMRGTTAIATASFGQGKVFCFSPHPEMTPGLQSFVHRAVRWSAGRMKEDE